MARTVKREQHTIDATGQPVGRLATQIATLLRGKHKPSFEPHLDEGDEVLVQNASKMKLTGNKMEQKIYHRYSGYPGGIKSTSAREMFEQDPGVLLETVVRNMLPDVKFRDDMLKRLTIQP